MAYPQARGLDLSSAAAKCPRSFSSCVAQFGHDCLGRIRTRLTPPEFLGYICKIGEHAAAFRFVGEQTRHRRGDRARFRFVLNKLGTISRLASTFGDRKSTRLNSS